MTTHDFVIDALAVQRLTRLVTEDTIFDRQRDWITVNAPDKLAYLVSCPHCVSIYAGAGVTLMRRVFPKAWSPVAAALALSAVTSLTAAALETASASTGSDRGPAIG